MLTIVPAHCRTTHPTTHQLASHDLPPTPTLHFLHLLLASSYTDLVEAIEDQPLVSGRVPWKDAMPITVSYYQLVVRGYERLSESSTLVQAARYLTIPSHSPSHPPSHPPSQAVLAHCGTQDLHFGPLVVRLGSACMENGQYELGRRGIDALGAVPVEGELENTTTIHNEHPSLTFSKY